MSRPFDGSRRRILLGAVGAGSALALGRGIVNEARASRLPTRPRTLVQIFLSGGLDAALSTDPKRRSEVEDKVSLGYEEHEILERPLHRVGPLFAPLGARLDRFAILNGVECSTVAHPIGQRSIRQMRRDYVKGGKSLCSLVGSLAQHRAPFDEIRIGDTRSGNGNFAEEMLGPQPRNLAWVLSENPDLWQRLWMLSRDGVRARVVREALRAHAGDRAGTTERAALEATAALLDAMPAEPPPRSIGKTEYSGGPPTFFDGDDWDRTWDSLPTTLWLMKNRLATSFFIDVNLAWDSHFLNTLKQKDCCSAFVPYLQRFLKGLDETMTPDGLPLSSEVGIVVSSELGRFPFLNPYGGKDHLPELPVLVAGPGIRPGTYGETNRHMAATPISFRTGRPGSASGVPNRVPVLEDMGASILSWFGHNDVDRLGYLGDTLDCLFA